MGEKMLQPIRKEKSEFFEKHENENSRSFLPSFLPFCSSFGKVTRNRFERTSIWITNQNLTFQIPKMKKREFANYKTHHLRKVLTYFFSFLKEIWERARTRGRATPVAADKMKPARAPVNQTRLGFSQKNQIWQAPPAPTPAPPVPNCPRFHLQDPPLLQRFRLLSTSRSFPPFFFILQNSS